MMTTEVWAAVVPSPPGFRSGGRALPQARAVVAVESRDAALAALRGVDLTASTLRRTFDPDEVWVASKAPGEVLLHSSLDDHPRWIRVVRRSVAEASVPAPGPSSGPDQRVGELVEMVTEILDRCIDVRPNCRHGDDPEGAYRSVSAGAGHRVTLMGPEREGSGSVLASVTPANPTFRFITYFVRAPGDVLLGSSGIRQPGGPQSADGDELDQLLEEVQNTFLHLSSTGRLRPAAA